MGKQTTEESGAEPELDFEAEANKIIEEMSWEAPKVEPKVETPDEEPKEKGTDEPSKEDVKNEEPKKDTTPTQEDELKIPRSRLNKEIDKKNSIQSKYDKLISKIKDEEKKFNSLSDDDKEEQKNLTKLWLDTKLSKLKDRLEEMDDDMSDKDNQIKDLQETIRKSETGKLAKRITELTNKMDGKDWLPKFDIKELLEFSKQKNFLPNDPIELYNFKYQAEIYAKKYEKKAPAVDKSNKGTFTPKKKIPTLKPGDKDFMDEANRIMDSIGKTT